MGPALSAGAAAAGTSAIGRFAAFADRLLGVCFCLIVLVNFASAAARYLGGYAFIGADELQVYAMVWLIFLGVAIVAWRNIHLRMDVLTRSLEGRGARWRDLLEALLMLVVCTVIAFVSLSFVLQIGSLGQVSDGAGIPMWLPHLSAFIGFALMAACAAWRLWRLAIRRA